MTPGDSAYSVQAGTVNLQANAVTMDVLNKNNNVLLAVTITALEGSTARVRIEEKTPLKPRYEVKEVVLPLTEQPLEQKHKGDDTVTYSFQQKYSVAVTFSTFRVDFFVGDDLAVTLNSRGLLNFEHTREKGENEEEGLWEETWKTHADSKPNGPQSIGIDVSFPGVEHVYGIPEHASTLSLKQTKGETDPYRLYNLDVFEYELDNPMALYGSIPFMQAHRLKQTTGVFLLNSAEMWIDIEKNSKGKGFTGMLRRLQEFVGTEESSIPQVDTHWMAESGLIDMFVFLGSGPKDILHQYMKVTGAPALPPLFSLAYHQCRWNYNDEDDVKAVSEKMDEVDVPLDVIWLDIEHTDGKRYFTWDTSKFPTPKDMQNAIAVKGRRMVNIVDPHIKRVGGYRIHEDATAAGIYVKNKDGNDYDGWCWPGSSSWLDFMNPDIQTWWADQFAFDKYDGTTEHMYFWNDMNEPSVFNGPEVTMHKDAKHFADAEHRDVHNIFGMWQQAATGVGIAKRSGGVERPFVLSRAFFAGVQRHGAIWTGDNKADWGHLKASVPMILSIGVAGLGFAGADMGGFFGNPETELLLRWYQAGSFQPFMRAHAHLDTKRREPYLFEGEELANIRKSVQTRYSFLSYWYTLFYEATLSGLPPMRPLWMEFPEDPTTFDIESVHMVGESLLVAPVTDAGATSVQCYFAGSETYYDIESGQAHQPDGFKTVAAPLRKIPVFQRAGTIIPRKMRVRRASKLMDNDPFTMDIALDSTGSAKGALFVDDYHTFAYQKEGRFAYYSMTFAKASATAFKFAFSQTAGAQDYQTKEWIEKLNIRGFPVAPTSIKSSAGADVDFTFDENQVLSVKKPASSLGNFELDITV